MMRESVMMAMRDGVRLATDTYFPNGARRNLPVLLTRTPYDRRTLRDSACEKWSYVKAGFVVAVQDLRGVFESEGAYRVLEMSIGAGERRPMVKNDALAIATVMSATVTCDHRVVDGAIGAAFLKAFRGFIEDPMAMAM
jgi:predicted alpha/beta hydrolase